MEGRRLVPAVSFAVKNAFTHLRRIEKVLKGVRAGKGTKPVHQLRVNCRRLRNIVKLFQGVFPARLFKKNLKNIKLLAKSASAARDLDVQIQFLKDYKKRLKTRNEIQDIEYFIQTLQQDRCQLQPRIVRAVDLFKKKKILLQLGRSLKRINAQTKRSTSTETYELLKAELLKQVNALLALESFAAQPTKVKELHQMRIAAKHLRYSLECLRPLYDQQLLSYCQEVLRFHRQLGELHDYDVWMERLSTITKEAAGKRPQALVLFQDFCRKNRQQVYQNFFRDWQRAREKRIFEDLLGYFYAYHG